MLPLLQVLAVAPLAMLSQQSYVFQLSTSCGNRTVHGLWPQWAEYCGGSFDVNAIAPLEADLSTKWPSCVGDDNATAFHEHEWLKHGTCSDFDERTYFETAMRLYDKFRGIPGLRVCLSRGALDPFTCAGD